MPIIKLLCNAKKFNLEVRKMNEQYTVIRAFQDKYNNQYYSIGETYNTQDETRTRELESGGYIAPYNTTMAKDAMAQQKNAQANAQELAKAHTQAAANTEPKTVVGGKVVPLKVAQAAEAAFDESNRTTGIQQHHDNTTEAVPAGQVASRSQSTAESAEVQARQQQTVKATNVQSGQQGMQQHLQQAEQELQQAQQQLEQQMQGQQGQQNNQQKAQAERQALAAAAEKTNPMAAEHETAAEMQAEAAKTTARARAKKDQ
jgi:hypothetical protein